MITTYILSNILKSKSGQKVKFGHLIECDMKNILLDNYAQNVMEKLASDFFPKN